MFHVALEEVGKWPTEVDGVFGFGYGHLNCNPTCSTPAYEFFLGPKNTDKNMFAMCMNDHGGLLALGSDGETEGLSGPVSHMYLILPSLHDNSFYLLGKCCSNLGTFCSSVLSFTTPPPLGNQTELSLRLFSLRESLHILNYQLK